MPPGRQPKSPDSYAGFVRYAALPQAATYRVTLSERGMDRRRARWARGQIDRRSAGALGCDGIRKSVKFDLSAAPFVIEISGTSAHEIAIAVTPD